MTENPIILNHAEAFASGVFENATNTQNGLAIISAQNGYEKLGCYTSKEMITMPFTAVAPCWNSDTPRGTSVEMQLRVSVNKTWSEWVSCGKWSPFFPRKSNSCGKSDLFCFEKGILTLRARQMATGVQLRIFLNTNDAEVTPTVHLLSVALRTSAFVDAESLGEPMHTNNPIPSYSQENRDPKLISMLNAPTALAMMMNRHGEDVLPEELAHACYDYKAHTFDNLNYITALAGSYGYASYAQWMELSALKKEVRCGCSFAAMVSYTTDEERAKTENLPLMTGANCTAREHMIVVHGFDTDEDDVQYVLVKDSLAANDSAASRRYLLSEFAKAWNGLVYRVRAKTQSLTLRPPERVSVELRQGEVPGEYALFVRGERHSLPFDLCDHAGLCSGTVCYAIQDNHAYATTATKRFFYTDVSQSGNILLDTRTIPVGTRIAVFIITENGRTLVAELKR